MLSLEKTKQRAQASQVELVVKNTPANAGDERTKGLILGLARSPAEGNGNPLQCSYLENRMDRGAWRATAKSWTRPKRLSMHTRTHARGTHDLSTCTS